MLGLPTAVAHILEHVFVRLAASRLDGACSVWTRITEAQKALCLSGSSQSRDWCLPVLGSQLTVLLHGVLAVVVLGDLDEIC